MTTYNSSKFQTNQLNGAIAVPPKFLEKGEVAVFATFQYNSSVSGFGSTTSGPVNGDIINMVQVPAGCAVTDVNLDVDQLDTNGTPTVTLAVGDASVPTRFISGSLIGRTGGFQVPNVAATLGYTYAAATAIQVKITAALATATVVAANLRLVVRYSADT